MLYIHIYMFIYVIQTAVVVLRRLTWSSSMQLMRCGVAHMHSCLAVRPTCRLYLQIAVLYFCTCKLQSWCSRESSIIAFCMSTCKYNHGDTEYQHNNVYYLHSTYGISCCSWCAQASATQASTYLRMFSEPILKL